MKISEEFQFPNNTVLKKTEQEVQFMQYKINTKVKMITAQFGRPQSQSPVSAQFFP